MNTHQTAATIRLFALALGFTAATAFATTFTTNTEIAVGDTAYDGLDIVVSGCTLTVTGQHDFASLLVTNSGVVTHAAAPDGQPNNVLSLTIAGDLGIDALSRMDLSGRGYAAGSGPGTGLVSTDGYGGGGGHGGTGGTAFKPTGAGGGAYGSMVEPVEWGSGGGGGGAGSGGGAARLIVAGTLRVDGTLAADGAVVQSGGGGAGGSLWITADTVTGSGLIAARGAGAGTSNGGGGGGRIALYFTQNTFAGTLTAVGGDGYQKGGAGTIYTKATGEGTGHLLVDNGDTSGVWTPLSSPEAFELTIRNHAKVSAMEPLTLGPLLVQTTGLLSCPAGSSGLSVTVSGSVGIDAGGTVDVSGLGHAFDSGPGTGLVSSDGYGGGGGHGGSGGTAYKPAGAGGGGYGSIVEPVEWGSGGGGDRAGSGGGAARLIVAGTLRVDGTLAADGAVGQAGGSGAGGSLWITADNVTGSGLIAARGAGAGASNGGGGGGRIALYFTQITFAGTLTAVGGDGYQKGGAGTIYTKRAADTYGLLLVDNGGNAGLTRINSGLWPSGLVFDLTISGASVIKSDAPQTFHDLRVNTGVIVTHDQAHAGFHWTCLGDAWIASGASFNMDGMGYTAESGPGAGQRDAYGYGSGAGHGGIGGSSHRFNPPNPGGGTYGSSTEPVTLGSGGGGGNGGKGGGAVRLTVAGTLHLDGALSANGLSGYGGGAGGSIWISAHTLVGGGAVSALGGAAGSSLEGRGGGGRIAIWANERSGYTGTVSAAGFSPGTIYLSIMPTELVAPNLEILRGNINFTIQQSVVGRRYQLQYSDTMAPGSWLDLGSLVVGNGNILAITTPYPPELQKCFYRVLLDP